MCQILSTVARYLASLNFLSVDSFRGNALPEKVHSSLSVGLFRFEWQKCPKLFEYHESPAFKQLVLVINEDIIL